MATTVKGLANNVGFLQRAFLGPDSKKPAGNGFTVANPNPKSNNGGATMAKSVNNVGTASVQQANQNTGTASVQQNYNFLDSDTYNGGGISSPFLNNPANNLGGTNNTGGSQGGGSTGGAGQQAMTFSNDYLERANELMTQLEKMMNSPFSYNYQSDPTYLAAVEAAKQNAKKASSNTMQTMSDRGIFNSSVTSNQLAEIEQEAQQAPMQLIPGLEANAYNRYQNQLSNTSSLMGTLLSAGQQQQNFDSNEKWKAVDERYREADVTGTYESPEMRQLLDAVVAAKNGYMSASTPEERAKFANAASSARAAMKALGMTDVDKLFGGGVNTDQALANFGNGGIKTVAAKQYEEGITYRDARDKVTDDHWKKAYDLDVLRANKPTGGGGGSNGPTFDQMLKGSTNRMMTQMLSEISSPEEIPAWIKANSKDIFEEGVDPSVLSKNAKAFFLGGDDVPTPETPSQIYEKAVDAAMKDPAWDKAKTEEEQQRIITKWHNRYSSYNGPQKPKADPVDTLFNFFKPFIPSKYGGGKQEAKPSKPSNPGRSTNKINAK